MDLSEFSFKAGASGLDATAKSKQIQAVVALLGAATAKAADDAPVDPASAEDKAERITAVVSRSAQPRSLRWLAESTVL